MDSGGPSGPCEKTYATLYLRHRSDSPDAVTDMLSITPTHCRSPHHSTFLRDGELRNRNPLHSLRAGHLWGRSSEGRIDSHEMVEHIDLLLDDMAGRELALADLRERGWEAEMSIFWRSRHGYGGPWLGSDTLLRLGLLSIPLCIDFYGSEPDENR